MATPTEIILNQDGEPTDLVAPADFGNGLAFLNPSDMPDLDAAEVGFNIQPESLEFKTPGQSARAVFNGFTLLKVKDQNRPGEYVDREAAVLQMKTGVKINMGANLLKQLKLIPTGTAVQITFKGEEKTNGGRNVKVYDVHILNVARANIAPIAKTAPAPAPTKQDEHKNGERIWSVAQKNALISVGLAGNDFAAKGMLDLSNLPDDAMGFEVTAWGTNYREQRTAINPETGKVYTAQQAAEYANTKRTAAASSDPDDLPY